MNSSKNINIRPDLAPAWRKVRTIFKLTLVLAVVYQPMAAISAPEVTIHQGVVQGQNAKQEIKEFLGVPFAAPPVGELRWQPAQPPAKWNGVFQATKYSPACAQKTEMFGNLFDANQSEDCLYLNIWTPDLEPDSPLPVMVYIHGGGLVGGAGTIPTLNGFALGQHKVVTVTINYRLGVLGFFAHPGLSKESAYNVSGNYGLSDQLAALRWVKANIAAFGGDPERVTLFGQSAGSISVISLMTSPLSQGLFHRAIAESGTPILRGYGADATLADAEIQGSAFATALKAESIAELRALPAEELMEGWNTFSRESGDRTIPITDGRILTQSPAMAFSAGEQMDIPFLTGSNSREGFPSNLTLEAYLHSVFGNALSRADSLYPESRPADPILGSTRDTLATDISFRCPAVVFQTWHAQKDSPTFAYHFEEPLSGDDTIGAQHSDEVSFVFGTLDMLTQFTGAPAVSEHARKLSDSMVNYWANFAKNGDPNGPGVPEWPQFTLKTKSFVRLNGDGIRADTKLREQACRLYVETVLPRLLTKESQSTLSTTTDRNAKPQEGPTK